MLENIKAGDTVYFRCGGSAVVDRVVVSPKGVHKVYELYMRLYMRGDKEGWNYRPDGRLYLRGVINESVFDIIRVEPKMLTLGDIIDTLENWDAVELAGGGVYYFVGRLPNENQVGAFVERGSGLLQDLPPKFCVKSVQKRA